MSEAAAQAPPARGGRASAFTLLRRNTLASAGLVVVALVCLTALAAPMLPLADPNLTAPENRLMRPGAPGHLLGTDALGRDILSRLIWGARVSIAVGLSATLIAAFFGSLIGLVAGYAGGRVDNWMMRGIDMVMAFPYILLALAIVAVLGPGLLNALYAIAIVNIPFFARNIRGVTLGLARREFVDAARLAGKSHAMIVVTEILPNVLPVIVITMSTTVGWMILETAGLSFLGLGAQPPQADLGSMLGEGRKILFTAPHVSVIPGLAILVLVMGINLLGDGVRDVLDPRLKSGALSRPVARTMVARDTVPRDAAARGRGAGDRRHAHAVPRGRTGLARGGGRRPASGTRRMSRPRGRERIGQVGHGDVGDGSGAHSAGPDRGRCRVAGGRGPVRHVGRGGARAARVGRGLCLSGPARHVASPVYRGRPDRRGDPRPPSGATCKGTGARHRPAVAGAHPQSRRADGRVPARIVGRHAAAGGHRHGACQRPQGPDRGRADHSTRRHGAGAGPGADGPAAARTRRGDPVHHPRFRRGLGDLRPGRGDVCGADRGDRADGRGAVGARASLHRAADRLRAGSGGTGPAARRDTGPPSDGGRPARRLRLRPALPAREGGLPVRRSRTGGARDGRSVRCLYPMDDPMDGAA